MAFQRMAPWRLRFIRTLLAVVALAVGVLIAWAGYFHQLEEHARLAKWDKVPCKILTWTVSVSQGHFGASVNPGMTYEYAYAGKTYRSSEYDAATDWVVDLRDFEAEGDAARRGPAFCYVNPADPSKSSFRTARLWYPYSLIGGGGLLAFLGLVALIRAYWPGRFRRDPTGEITLSRWMRQGVGVAGALLIWLGVDLFISYGTAEELWAQSVRSQLVQVPARVEATGITSRKGSGKNSHRTYHDARLVYSYEHGGRRWYSDRWYFETNRLTQGSDKLAREILQPYTKGRIISCWILSDKPWFATLDPAFKWFSMLWNLLPLAFVVGGLVMFRLSWKMR
jgi:hypothetical protein